MYVCGYKLAACTSEALLMVGVPERGDDLSLDVLVAGGAPRAERALVVLNTHAQYTTSSYLCRGLGDTIWRSLHVIGLN